MILQVYAPFLFTFRFMCTQNFIYHACPCLFLMVKFDGREVLVLSCLSHKRTTESCLDRGCWVGTNIEASLI